MHYTDYQPSIERTGQPYRDPYSHPDAWSQPAPTGGQLAYPTSNPYQASNSLAVPTTRRAGWLDEIDLGAVALVAGGSGLVAIIGLGVAVLGIAVAIVAGSVALVGGTAVVVIRAMGRR